MKNILSALLGAGLVAVAACSKSGPGPAAAVISVSVGNPSGTGTGMGDLVTTSFTSFAFAQHADQALGLAKQWGLPVKDADQKIRAALSVRPGEKPDQFIIEAPGLEHDVAVKVVNELCTYYSSLHPSITLADGKSAVLHASVVTPAK